MSLRSPKSPRNATADPALTARVTARVPLHYDAGADIRLDRPAFVRSGSSLAWSAGGIVVIQDDANFLAVFDPAGRRTRAITLPAGKDGLRRFDDLRGNKKHRLDLEACVAIEYGQESMLLAFGSGSSGHRERVPVSDLQSESPEVTGACAPTPRRVAEEAIFAAATEHRGCTRLAHGRFLRGETAHHGTAAQ
jgi:hypothetical protein